MDLFRVGVYTQTTAAQPAAAAGYFLGAHLYLSPNGSFDGGTFTPAGGSANALTVSGSALGYESPLSPTLIDFNTAFPPR